MTPKNENFNKKKTYLILKYVFLLKFFFLGAMDTSYVCNVGMGWMQN